MANSDNCPRLIHRVTDRATRRATTAGAPEVRGTPRPPPASQADHAAFTAEFFAVEEDLGGDREVDVQVD
jgi:hypothetical protein